MKYNQNDHTLNKEKIATSKRRDALLRFLTKKHEFRYRFGQLSELERTVLSHTITAANGRIAYVKNSKAGCTTVANLLHMCDHGSFYGGNIHHAPGGVRDDISRWPTIKRSLVNGVSFSTVRNPLRRSVSAFLDFFITQRNAESTRHTIAIQSFGFSNKSDISYKFDVYLNYIGSSFSQSELHTDRHFRPQHINLGHGLFVLSYIGKIETLDKDLKIVGELSGVEIPLSGSLPNSRQNRSLFSAFEPTAEQRRHIETLYAQDFEIYGY